MHIDRRKFLVAGAAVAAGCTGGPPASVPTSPLPPEPAPRREPTPDAFVPEALVDLDRFPWGLRVGDPGSDSARVAVFAEAERVSLHLRVHQDGAWSEVEVQEVGLSEGFAHVVLEGLTPDTAYTVWADVEGVRSEATRFRTAPGADSPLRQLVIGATSCLGGNPITNLDHVAGEDLDLFCFLGDLVYADGSVTQEEFRWEWHRKLTLPQLRTLSATTGWVTTWDDHEVANNWFIGENSTVLQDAVTLEQVQVAVDAFREAVPMGQGPGGSGFWRRVSWGNLAELFVLDCRGERGEDTLVSEAQLAWLEEALVGSSAAFKIVLTSVHMTDHLELMSVIASEDRWQGYPDQRARVLEVVGQVPGAFFITGDMHFGAVQRVDSPGGPGAELYEVAVGPSGSNLFRLSDVAAIGGGEIPDQYETVVEDWSWSRLTLDPGTHTVRVEFIGNDGSVIAEQTFSVLQF